MSGGVDSSVAAALLAREGRDVVGFTLNIWPAQSGEPGARNCCSPRSIDDARRVCAILGIPHYVLDFREVFAKTVIDRFAASYFEGITPNPCIDCNQFIKFGALHRKAREIGAGAIATGHCARADSEGPGGRRRLLRGSAQAKDQSYVLYVLSQDQLAAAVFPLGELDKPSVREIAADLGLPVADKPESMDICFAAGDYRSFARDWTGKRGEPGPIEDATGRRVGTHRGLEEYTVGQRKGLGIALAEPAYVTAIDVGRNVLRVGCHKDALVTEFEVRDLNLVSVAAITAGQSVTVKVRSRMAELPARVFPLGGTSVRVVMQEPAWAVAPGQAAVFYDGDVVVGGGRIARPLSG